MKKMTLKNQLPDDVLDELRVDRAVLGDASGMLGRAIAEIERLRAVELQAESLADAMKNLLMHIGRGREDGVEWVCEPIHSDEIRGARAALAAVDAA